MKTFLNIDLQKTLSLQEVKDFFDMTGEFQVTDAGDGMIKITMSTGGPNPEFLSTTVFEPCIQTLIRDIIGLGFRNGMKAEKEKA